MRDFIPYHSSLRSIRTSSYTRCCVVRLSPIANYSRLLPPVGVEPVSQCSSVRSLITSRITVIGLVGRYPTNYLIVRTHLPIRIVTSFTKSCDLVYRVLAPLSRGYSRDWGNYRTYYSAVRRFPDLHRDRSTCIS